MTVQSESSPDMWVRRQCAMTLVTNSSPRRPCIGFFA
jgi:hypothetical protein